ncbi:MAG: saccharopine dehydrogenase C-terminal domain-containing protein [Chitinophagales bacterium]|nr:saccharopine dehydrogenase C-terminal domain-containing protein [Chitinophagales bacterium]
MKKITVLGAGMVGKAIAIDLAKMYQVRSADISQAALDELSAQGIEGRQADLSNTDVIKEVVADADLVVGAVPGFMGFQMAKTVLEAGKNLVDISFFPEDIFLLDKLAKEKNVIAIFDCGVAPGLSNLVVGYHHQSMIIQNFECYVGGLPKTRQWPYQYKAPFSPIDVIEEYTRPARIIVGGKEVVKEALSECELMDFGPAGMLEAFNSDGLRSLVKTVDIPNMKEKTLRYPGHVEYMQVLRATGFFDKEPIMVNGQMVSPLDMTTKLLFPKWKLEKEEQEFTVMKILVEGKENGQLKRYTYDLYDEYDPITKTSSMARTTGYTCTAAVSLVLQGEMDRPGVYPPEFIGARPSCFKLMLQYLQERGVAFKIKEEILA